MALAGLLDEGVDQARDVRTALPQGRQRDRQDVQPVVQVLAERPRDDQALQALIGRRDDPYVDPDHLLSPYPVELLLFQDTQKPRLGLEGHFTDLVEKDRAA